MKCPKCGTEMDERAKYCPICGERMYSDVNGQEGYRPYAPEPPRYQAPISRRSIPVCIILSIITCGIYGLYWLYSMAEDLNALGGNDDDTSGGMVVLLSIVTCSIYELYWLYKAGTKINDFRYRAGQREDSSLGFLYLLLAIFGFSIVSFALIQNELNKVAGL